LPYADPNKSFDAAVRHLFRHLADGKVLRRNPLARGLLHERRVTEDAELVAAVKGRVLQLARPCCSEYAALGLQLQARRRYAIIRAICDGESGLRTATRLNLSQRQYYRERHAVCTQVARLMRAQSEPAESRVQIADPLRLLFSRSESLADQGLAKSAAQLLDQAWPSIARGESRLTARFRLVDALILSGNLERAARLLQYSHGELSRDCGVSIEDRDRAVLMNARHDLASGRDAQGGPALQALANAQMKANRTSETALDTLLELGRWQCSGARFSDARKSLQRAQILTARLPRVSPKQQISLSLLYAYCAEDIVDTYNGSHHRFHDCLELGIANASVRGALEATIGLMGYYASAGREAVALSWAERALEMARAAEGTNYLLFAAAWISTTLLKTRYWRAVDPLVFEAEALARPGTLHWLFIKEAQGDFLARIARYRAAEESFTAAAEATRILQNRKWQTIVYRDRALMLERLGSAESVESARRALELADAGAVGAWSRCLTYQATSKILGEPRNDRHADTGLNPAAECRSPFKIAPFTLMDKPTMRRAPYILP